jgi:hypothetical protein
VGLFQLNIRGAGAGMNDAARMDPAQNTRRIIEEVMGAHGAPVRAARGSATHMRLASLFAQHVERCWACGWGGGSSELTARSELVRKLFGDVVAMTVP